MKTISSDNLMYSPSLGLSCSRICAKYWLHSTLLSVSRCDLCQDWFFTSWGGKREEYSENEALRRMSVACSEQCGAVGIYKKYYTIKTLKRPLVREGYRMCTSGLVGVIFFCWLRRACDLWVGLHWRNPVRNCTSERTKRWDNKLLGGWVTLGVQVFYLLSLKGDQRAPLHSRRRTLPHCSR